MHANIINRPYRPDDRAVVRQICQDTADRGRPLPTGAMDPELVADLMTRYYTDIDSRWAWVAEAEGTVIGYVMAATDTHAFRRAMTWRISPRAVIRAVFRGLLFSQVFRIMANAVIRQHGRNVRPNFPIPEGYPAHLHINLRAGYRGQGVGERLIGRSIAQLHAAKVSGVHATVRADNPGGCKFFERMDFKALDHYDVIMPCEGGIQNVRVMVYGRRMGP